ncbi:NnrS family protein [Myxococcota bacterium]|nr:NnrS family protein [Myxococcota bacterium]
MSDAPTSSLHHLSAEAYRPLFPLAMALGLVLTLAWALRLFGHGPALTPALHGLLFTWGFLGTAVLGFLLTAYPRQNDAAPPAPGLVLAVGALQAQAVVLGLLGWGPAAAAVFALTWLVVGGWSVTVAVPSLRRRWDATTAGAPLTLLAGAAGLALWPWWPTLAADLGILGFLVPLALVLLDRLLPFFSSKRVPGYAGRRLPGFLPALVLALGARVALGDLPAGAAAADLAAAAVLVRQIWGWRPWPAARLPLIGVLYLGVAWILAGLLLDATLILLGGPPGLLARHLWTLGGLLTLVVGISVRVVRGHGGQALALGADGAAVVGLVQLAVLLRAGLPLLGVQAPALVYGGAAAALSLALLLWLVRLGPGVLQAPAAEG